MPIVARKDSACAAKLTPSATPCLVEPQAVQINGMQLGNGVVRVTRSRTAMNPVKQEFLPRSVRCRGVVVNNVMHAVHSVRAAHVHTWELGLSSPVSAVLGITHDDGGTV